MIPGLGALGGGAGGVSASSSASSGPNVFGGGGSMFGGINTGTQGIDLTTLAVIGAIAIVALLVIRR